MKETLRKKKGITLVALVVTIVVMLILAGVSLNVILGDQGILKKAKDGADKTKVEAIKEGKMLYEAEKYMEATDVSLLDYLEEKGLINSEERAEIEATNKLVIGDYTISFAKRLVDAFKDGELQVGDWVNYKNPTSVSVTGEGYTSTGYTSPASRTGMSEENIGVELNQEYTLNNAGSQVNWRVLGLSEDGNSLLLTTGSPLKREFDTSAELTNENNPYFWLYGAEGTAYEYGLKELDKICAIYKNDLATESRSLTIDDINRLCGVTVDVANSKVYKTSDSTKTNIDLGGNIGQTYSYPTTSYPTQYASPEDFLTGTSSSFSKTSDAYYYAGSDAISSTSALYDVLFSHTGQEDGDYRYYWLASRAVYVGSGFCGFGPGDVYGGEAYSGGDDGLFGSVGSERGDGYAVRPVVSLKSEVTVEDIQKLETAPTSGEEAWSYSW